MKTPKVEFASYMNDMVSRLDPTKGYFGPPPSVLAAITQVPDNLPLSDEVKFWVAHMAGVPVEPNPNGKGVRLTQACDVKVINGEFKVFVAPPNIG